MSDLPAPAPRPVALVTIIAILVFLGLFLFVARRVYLRHLPDAPQNQAPEGFAADQKWRATAADRRAYLAELRAKQEKQAESYGWVDRKNNVVQLPIERAMELVAQEYGSRK